VGNRENILKRKIIYKEKSTSSDGFVKTGVI